MMRLTVLQLDTSFPRVPGDVASPASYRGEVQIVRIPRASVGAVVNARPDRLDITPFEAALANITQGIITTSCGFLFYWHEYLAGRTHRPLITSALCRLRGICNRYGAGKVAIITFDAAVLAAPAYAPLMRGFDGPIIGLEADHHLRRVIADDLACLDAKRAEAELCAHLDGRLDGIEAVVLECTNLPPYKAAIRRAFGVAVFDILACLEDASPGLVEPAFL